MKKIGTTREYAEMLYHLHRQGTMNEVGEKIYKRILTKGDEFKEVDTKQSRQLKKEFSCKLGQCYYNAQMIMISNPRRFYYYEGWMSYIIPLEHGWLVDRQTGLVVDPTLNKVKKKGDYFGLKIPVKVFMTIQEDENMARQVMFDYLTRAVRGNSNGER